MTAITRLQPRERVVVDSQAIGALLQRHGPAGAEQLLADAVCDLTDRLAALDGALRGPAPCAAAASAQDLDALAARIGLTALARALGALAQAGAQGNAAALPALWARVTRVGDISLAQLWETPQLRM